MARRKAKQPNNCANCGAPLDAPQPGQTELRCRYCGVAVAVEHPVPAPDTPGKWAEHSRAVQRDNIRMVLAVLGFSLFLGAIPATCSGVSAVMEAWKSKRSAGTAASTAAPPPPALAPPPPSEVDPKALEEWGRRSLVSSLDRLHRCGLGLVKEEAPRRFTLAVYFNENGSVRDTNVDMHPKPMTLIHFEICVIEEMRGRKLTEERPPAQRSFNIKVPLEFDKAGNAHESTGAAEPEAAEAETKQEVAASAAPKTAQNAASKMTNEEWGRRRILARLDRLQGCGRDLLDRNQAKAKLREQGADEPPPPRRYLVTVPFDEHGNTGQAKLSPPSPIADCVDWHLRQFVTAKEGPPKKGPFQIQIPITFDDNGNASVSP
ncbi:hypothetical protein LZC95_29285 [Pendulispora brunnea]|uniref:Uncharacterized protein n=1 Tax=Pendulispora brunnea TaxID=2905690 RepID=A0ABZ2JW11_9BACT